MLLVFTMSYDLCISTDVCKARKWRNNSRRVGPTNCIWKFYDNATLSTASVGRKRCHQGVYELAVPFGFTMFIPAVAITWQHVFLHSDVADGWLCKCDVRWYKQVYFKLFLSKWALDIVLMVKTSFVYDRECCVRCDVVVKSCRWLRTWSQCTKLKLTIHRSYTLHCSKLTKLLCIVIVRMQSLWLCDRIVHGIPDHTEKRS